MRRINGAGLKNAMPRFFDNQPYPLLGSFQSNCKWLYWSPLTVFRPSDKHSDWGRKHHPLLLLANVIKDFASRNSDKALMLVQTYLICGAGILNVIIQFQFEIPGAHRTWTKNLWNWFLVFRNISYQLGTRLTSSVPSCTFSKTSTWSLFQDNPKDLFHKTHSVARFIKTRNWDIGNNRTVQR